MQSNRWSKFSNLNKQKTISEKMNSHFTHQIFPFETNTITREGKKNCKYIHNFLKVKLHYISNASWYNIAFTLYDKEFSDLLIANVNKKSYQHLRQ